MNIQASDTNQSHPNQFVVKSGEHRQPFWGVLMRICFRRTRLICPVGWWKDGGRRYSIEFPENRRLFTIFSEHFSYLRDLDYVMLPDVSVTIPKLAFTTPVNQTASRTWHVISKRSFIDLNSWSERGSALRTKRDGSRKKRAEFIFLGRGKPQPAAVEKRGAWFPPLVHYRKRVLFFPTTFRSNKSCKRVCSLTAKNKNINTGAH